MNNTKNKKTLTLNKISQSVLMTMMLASTQAMSATTSNDYKTIGDLEIYKLAEGGGATLTMMLDISGSMNSSDSNGQQFTCNTQFGVAPNASSIQQEAKTIYLTDTKGNRINSYTDSKGRSVDISRGITYTEATCQGIPTRITKMKNAVIALVSGEKALDESNKIGIGVFPHKLNASTGAIEVPAKALTNEHRWRILQYIADLEVTAATPSAHAYAEIGAYMLGTSTATPTRTRDVMTEVGSLSAVGGVYTLKYCGFSSIINLDGTAQSPATTLNFGGKSYSVYSCTNTVDFPYRRKNWASGTFNYTPAYNNNSSAIDFGLLPSFDAYYAGRNSSKMTNSQAKSANWYNNAAAAGQTAKFLAARTIQDTDNNRSGFGVSHPDTKKADGRSYQSPVESAQCSGQGIYFMTDGEPNRSDASSAGKMMAKSLGQSTYSAPNYGGTTMEQGDADTTKRAVAPNGQVLNVDVRYSLWNYMGAYAKDLRARSLKTATLGFGYVFNPTNGLKYKTATNAEGKSVRTVDCEASFSKADARNLCRLGAQGYGYGEGGFLATSQAEQVTQSIKDFAESLKTTIDPTPAGTISIPKDPLSIFNIQPYAYLPIVEPKPSESVSVWRGNLKKYHTLKGTLYGDNNERLYKTSNAATTENAGYPFAVNASATDIWQKSGTQGGSVEVGGTLNQIPNLQGNSTTRQVYVENIDPRTKARTIQLITVRNGNAQGLNTLTGYSFSDKAYLLNYLGFAVNTEQTYTSDAQLNQALKTAQVSGARHLGGVLHSTPVLATYEGDIDDNTGNVTSDESKRDDNILYGSMDGGLHMVSAKDGEEHFTFIPRAMFDSEKQRKAMVRYSKNGIQGSPAFGVDAPWLVNASYNFSIDDNKIKYDANKGVYAYGGLRMGGNGIYGLNISNKKSPSLAFGIDDKSTGFERMGQIWSQPLAATVQDGNQTKDVLIFGGGYDMCYEDPNFKLNDPNSTDNACKNKTQAQGNAIYMVDAKNGTLVKSWTDTNMKHSIVAKINGLDRNNDGIIDHLYAADLGGQIFRVDLKGSMNNSTVVRVFDANGGITNPNHINFRFYERPIVSFYDHNNSRFAVINVASGDRSSPLSKNRGSDTSASTDANRIYGVFDVDVANSERGGVMGANPTYRSRDLNNSHLQRLDTKVLETGTNESRKTLMDGMKASLVGNSQTQKFGWYYDMVRFAGNIDVPYLKAVGPGMVTGSVYYASIYSPEYQYAKDSTCSAKIEGGTERQMYCLPWGICANDAGAFNAGNNTGSLAFTSKNGTLGFIKAGPGIQELAVTTITNTKGESSPFRTLVSHQTVDEDIKEPGKYNSSVVTGADGGFGKSNLKSQITNGKGSDEYARRDPETDGYTLRVQRWYDLKDAESN